MNLRIRVTAAAAVGLDILLPGVGLGRPGEPLIQMPETAWWCGPTGA